MPPSEIVIRVPAADTAPRAARQSIAELSQILEPHVFQNLELLVSELVTNSVRHADVNDDSDVTLKVRISPDTVSIEVIDPGAGFVAPTSPRPRQGEGGYGLYLVDQLARRWGVDRLDQGTRVWFDLARG